jgi:UrcA family protein
MKSMIGKGTVAALLLGVAATVLADASEYSVRKLSVNYADLDLTGAAGRAVLAQRVRNAVNEVCEYPGIIDARTHGLVEACRQRATAEALAAIERQVALRQSRHRATEVASAVTAR